MEALIAIVVLLLILKFGGSILDGMFASVGALGKILGFLLGAVLVVYFLMNGCS